MSEIFFQPESKIALERGLSRMQLKKFREEKLVKGKDWINRPRDGGVLWSEEAVRNHLNLSDVGVRELAIPSKLSSQFPTATAPPLAQNFTVIRIPPNPRVVLARDSNDEMQTVWVGRNQMFVVGDVIPAEPDAPGLFRFTGVLPRDRRRARLRPAI